MMNIQVVNTKTTMAFNPAYCTEILKNKAQTTAKLDRAKRRARQGSPNVMCEQKMNFIQNYKEFDVFFKNADHIDVKTIEGDTDLRSFISGMLSYNPWWIASLYRIREIFVGIFGLVRHEKPEASPSLNPEELSFKSGENASFFVVRCAKEDMYWVAESPKDKHLMAFFGVVAEKINEKYTNYHVFTSVKYLHWTGPVYFNLIRPFHHIVLRSMMKAGTKKRHIT